MSKTIKNSFNKNLTYEKMLKAYERALKNKASKKDVLKFNVDLETNLWNIINELKKGTYKMGKYKTFKIYEPKERLIKSLPFKDRIVQQWYIYEFIKPYFMKRFIIDTFACIDNRGTHSAVNRVQEYMRYMQKEYKKYYILKCDIKGFFYNIDKNILFKIMLDVIIDRKLLNLTKLFIFDEEEKGIPIGNYTSQYFANIYLNILDHYVKEKLKIKYYVRYMDDFIIFTDTKEKALNVMKAIKSFLNKKLKLELNKKSKYYPNKLGINFCGYIVYETHKLLRKGSKIQIKKRIKVWNKLSNKNMLNEHRMLLEWNSFMAHASHANSYKFISKIYNKIDRNDFLKH
ncbi:MAG TPA: reverse transcriptase domain-containing protein [Bacilli bacterium]|nr:reverse transcriptase domain-containing protein [Bacilli bacterium]